MAIKKWVCEYEVDGVPYGLTFDTYDYEDPEDRIRGMKESLVLKGELKGIVHADSDDVLDFDYPD